MSISLGDLIVRTRHSVRDLETWLAANDAAAADHVATAARDRGETLATFARVAVADFVEDAAHEDWTRLISVARDAVDPGHACLMLMIRWRIEQEGAS